MKQVTYYQVLDKDGKTRAFFDNLEAAGDFILKEKILATILPRILWKRDEEVNEMETVK
jgi:hypothetical protein